MRHPRSLALLVLPCVTILSSACDDNETSSSEPTGTVVVSLVHRVGSADLELAGDLDYTNASGNSFNVTKVDYVLSEVSLLGESTARREGEVAIEGVHYVSADDPSTTTFTFENVPVGEYEGIHFRFGIVGSDNVAGAFPDLDVDGMAWPPMLGGGYHYMRIEGNFVNASDDTLGFATHTGPSMSNDYSVPVDLEVHGAERRRHVELEDGDTLNLHLVMDINEWYVGPNLFDLNTYAGPIMGDTSAQELLEENGATVWSAEVATP